MAELTLAQRLVGTIWVCQNCLMVIANGDDSGRGDDDAEPCTKIEGYEVSPGFGWEDHEDDCPNHGPNDYSAGYVECECETRDFSWSRCDGCEDGLGGARYACTLWAPFGAKVNPNYKIGGSYWLDFYGNPLPN